MAELGKKRRLGWSWRLVVLSVLAAGVLLAAGYRLRGELAADHLQRRLATAPAEEVTELVEAIAGLGDAGTSRLVAALASPRAEVVAAARGALREQVDRWEALDASRAASKLAKLVEALAAGADALEPAERTFAADLALRALLCPAGGEGASLGGHCERIFKIAAQKADGASGPEGEADGLAAAAEMESKPVPLPGQLRSPLDVLDLPGGGLPIDGLMLEADSRADGAAETAAADGGEPRRHEAESAARPLAETPTRARQGGGDDSPIVPSAADGPTGTDDGGIRPVGMAEPLAAMTPAELLRALRGAGDELRRMAGDELRKRGWPEREVVLALHLAGDDAGERRRWAESLPRISGLDAKPWLLWLSEDDDPEVRLVALTLMATTRDPEMLAVVARMGRDDADGRVRQQAARLFGDSSRP